MTAAAADVLRGIDLSAIPIAVLADVQILVAKAIHAQLQLASGRLWATYEPRVMDMPTQGMTPDQILGTNPSAAPLFADSGSHSLNG